MASNLTARSYMIFMDLLVSIRTKSMGKYADEINYLGT